MYAKNLLNGHYSPRGEIFLWNGPGYPIVLMPFIKLKVPWLAAKLLNPLFLFIAILYFYRTLCLYTKEKPALYFTYILGAYPPFSRYINLLLTEQLAIMLTCGFMYHSCKLLKETSRSWTYLLVPSMYLGFLALTKIFFGYVILIGIFLFFFLYAWKKKDQFKKILLIYVIALISCVPYLTYTYSLTGKIFFWGNRAQAMYLMSTPYEGEYGDWFTRKSKHHRKFYKKIAGLSVVERERELRKQAIKNIINYPAKYVMNVMANIGRLFFNYPYSYDFQRLSTYFYIIPNMFIFVFCIMSIYPAYIGRKLIPFEINALIVFVLISIGGLSIVHSENRSLWPFVPIIVLWLSFILTRILKIELKKETAF